MRAKRSTKRTIRPIRLDPVGHSATVEFDLFVIANQFMRALEREILSQLMPVVFAEVAAMRARAGDVMMRDGAGANARAVISYLKVRAAISGADVLTKATGSIQAEGVRHTRKWTASINAGTSVDVSALLRDDDLVDVLSLRSGEFNSLITNLGNSTLERIERQTLGAIFEGRSNADIEKALRETIGLSKARAKLIARDQASKLNGAMNEFRQRQAGVTHYTWRTVLDGRERDTHRARNGKVFSWATPPKGTGHPGNEINCFPGSTRVTLANGCHKLWRRNYIGTLVSVKTSDGTCLEATPNHPVLTARGWLAVNDLQEGDYVIKAALDRGVVNENDERHFEVCLHDLFEAVALREGFHSARSTPADFHGDGIEGDIDAVLVESFLPRRAVSESDETVENFLFAGADRNVGIAALDACGPLGGGPNKVFSGQGSDASMGCGRKIAALAFGHVAHADVHGAASRAAGDVVLGEHAIDDGSAHPEFSGEGFLTDAAPISCDDVKFGQAVHPVRAALAAIDRGVVSGMPSAESVAESVTTAAHDLAGFGSCGPVVYERLRVVQKSVREFSGHVYNLESSTSWYIACSLIVHNCRCRASAVLIDDEADAAEISEVDDPPDFDAASELLGRVREMSRSDLLSLPREALLLKRAEVQTARQFVGASKSAASAEDIERTFEAVFGFPSAGQDLVKMSGVGTVVGALRSRRSLMLAAIESRIDLVDDILAHAVETAPN